MTDLTPEVKNASGGAAAAELVRLMTGEIDVRSLPKEDLYAIASALVPDKPRSLLHQALGALNDQGETFAQIAARLGVHEATAARWAKPPSEDRRRRRGADDAISGQQP